MRILCLVCPEIAGEQEKAQRHFDEVGIQAEFINGIHGVTSGLQTSHTYEFDHPGTDYHIGPKTLGMMLSHIIAWNTCALLPDDTFLILESDAKFPPDWKLQLAQAFDYMPPDWDVLYVGSCNCDNKPKQHIGGNVYKFDCTEPHHAPQCTHAILYHRKAIPTIIRTQRKFWCGSDLALVFHSLPLLNTYAVLPRIADQFDTEILP